MSLSRNHGRGLIVAAAVTALISAGFGGPQVASASPTPPSSRHPDKTTGNVNRSADGVKGLHNSKTANGYKKKLKDGPWPDASHVQGIAVDRKNGYVYYSFTTLLVKTDLKGNVIGTVTGWNEGSHFDGHLGDITYKNGHVYGSLEYKQQKKWYIAIFGVNKIYKRNMDIKKHPSLLKAVYLNEVVKDYSADMNGDGVFDGDTADTPDHRYGSSGIDGTSFGPAFGSTGGRQYLTVAYGVYSNKKRSDNNHQVLLQYDVRPWAKYAKSLKPSDLHQSGPKSVTGKYFVHTGNTNYGVQNLKYDRWSKRWLMGVYPGKKEDFPNYELFAVNAQDEPTYKRLKGIPSDYRGKKYGRVLPLADAGLKDSKTGVRGWNKGFSTGFFPLGHGLYYISKKTTIDGDPAAELTLNAWTGKRDGPLTPVKGDNLGGVKRAASTATSARPTVVRAGKQVTVSVRVKNTGSTTFSGSVAVKPLRNVNSLKTNGRTKHAKVSQLSPNQSADYAVTFTADNHIRGRWPTVNKVQFLTVTQDKTDNVPNLSHAYSNVIRVRPHPHR